MEYALVNRRTKKICAIIRRGVIAPETVDRLAGFHDGAVDRANLEKVPVISLDERRYRGVPMAYTYSGGGFAMKLPVEAKPEIAQQKVERLLKAQGLTLTDLKAALAS